MPEVAVVIGSVYRIVFAIGKAVVAENIASNAKDFNSVGIKKPLGLRIIVSAFEIVKFGFGIVKIPSLP